MFISEDEFTQAILNLWGKRKWTKLRKGIKKEIEDVKMWVTPSALLSSSLNYWFILFYPALWRVLEEKVTNFIFTSVYPIVLWSVHGEGSLESLWKYSFQFRVTFGLHLIINGSVVW